MTCHCQATDVNCIDSGPNGYGYNAGNLVLYQIGDFGVNASMTPLYDPAEQELADLIASQNPGIVITSGDNDYVGNYAESVEASYGRWVDRERFFPVPGNHDWDYTGGGYYGPDTLTGYLSYFDHLDGRRYYDKRLGSAHLFFLDSGYDSAGNMMEPDGNTAGTFDAMDNPVGGSVQWNWFVNKVRSSTARWKIAIAHHPDLTSGTNHGPYPAMAWHWTHLGIDLRLAGHEHSYERLIEGSVSGRKTTHVVNGAGGQTLTGFGVISPYSVVRYNAMHGALRLEITPEKLSGRFMDQNGVTRDSFTLTK